MQKEVELTPKRPRELQQKLQDLCRSTYIETATKKAYRYSMIHFYVPDKVMQQYVERACLHLEQPEQERVNVRLDASL